MDVVFANAGITEKGSLLPEKEGKPVKPELATVNVNLIGVMYSAFLVTAMSTKKE